MPISHIMSSQLLGFHQMNQLHLNRLLLITSGEQPHVCLSPPGEYGGIEYGGLPVASAYPSDASAAPLTRSVR